MRDELQPCDPRLQPSLFDPPARPLWGMFVEFHRDNPGIWRLFCRFADEVWAAGRTRYGARAVFERIRWHVEIETRGAEPFKLNDHLTPYYARLYECCRPSRAGFFETRALRNPPDRLDELMTEIALMDVTLEGLGRCE